MAYRVAKSASRKPRKRCEDASHSQSGSRKIHEKLYSISRKLCDCHASSRRFFAARKNPCLAGALHLQYRDMKRPLLVAVLSAIFATNIIAQTPTPAPSPAQPPADYNLRWGVKIPMRNKVELNATLYLPKTPNGSPPKTPVIFTLTPYISDTYHARGAYFASHGYVFALVDVRGRGNSGGE